MSTVFTACAIIGSAFVVQKIVFFLDDRGIHLGELGADLVDHVFPHQRSGVEDGAQGGAGARRGTVRTRSERQDHSDSDEEDTSGVNETTEQELLERHMGRAVLPCSKRSYNSQLNHWEQYRQGVRVDRGLDVGAALEHVEGNEAKVRRILLFHAWLYETKGFRSERVGKIMSALRDAVRSKGLPIDWLSDVRLVDSKTKSCAMSTEETRVDLKAKEARVKVGVPLDLLHVVRQRCITGAPKGSAGLDKRARAIGILAGVNDTRRISNLVLPGPKDEDHSWRYEDAKFKVVSDGRQANGVPEISEWVPAIRLAHVVMILCNGDAGVVTEAIIAYPTDKTSRTRGPNAPADHFWGRGTTLEDLALSDLVSFICDALPVGMAKLDTKLLTRFHDGRMKTVTKKEIVKELQDAAEAAGLDRSRFSAKSLRLAGPSHGGAEGVPAEVVNAQGGWSQKSKTAERHYCRKTKKVRGILAIGNPDTSLNEITIESTKDLIQRLSVA